MSYSALTAYYKNSLGNIVAAPSSVYRLTATSACRTQASCAGTADEVKAEIVYGSAGVANNLLPTRVTSGAGDNSLTATVEQSYDAFGNVTSVDGPLSGVEDTIFYRYDALRRPVGTISPDPDGVGPMKRRAVRTTYNGDGNVTKVERGTVEGTSDADWAAFAGLEAVETSYDTLGRPVASKLVAGGTTHALTQVSYDAKGRAECSATRMDPADFAGALPGACTPTTPDGPNGPDRIVKTLYNAADEVTEVRTAVGTLLEAAEVTTSYTPNGQVETLTDGENNKTTYVYDGHDRLSKTLFPSPTKGAGTSNPDDYEQLGYELTAAGTRTSGTVATFRNRAGQTIGFGHDALGRMTSKDMPGTEPDASFGYDLMGRMTDASQPGSSLTFGYDALSRRTSESGPFGTKSFAYDVGGRLTRITHGDGFYVEHDHLVTGEVERIRENGATSGAGVLATFGYDQLGRRTSLTRGNGTSTAYKFDAASRLEELKQLFPDASKNLTLGFSYNPASQIVTNTRSNDLYSWFAHSSGTTSTPANGLNQLTAVDGTSISHDPDGNRIALDYDERGNIIKRTDTAKPGSNLDPIVQEASYLDGGTVPVLAWRPEWIKDGKGNQTDFSYTPQGLLEQQLDPAVNGLRKRTFIEYEEVPAGQPDQILYRRKKVRSCEVAAANPATCLTPEHYTIFNYLGATFLPTEVSEVSPADGLTRTTVTEYDGAGRPVRVDGPLAGTADAVYFRYDLAGRKTWEIGAADESGRRQAKRFTYRAADDKIEKVETGYVTSHDAAAFVQAFTTLDTTFDGRRNPVREQLSGGGLVHSVTSRSFLDRGLPLCTATRMNPGTWAGLTDACTQTAAGPFGADRIVRNAYDAAGQLVQVREGVGTAVEAAEATFSYTGNGLKRFVIDGNGNRAELRYDGHGRLARWVFPSKTRPDAFNDSTQATALATAGALNELDFEEYGYDPNGNRISLRKRDGSTLGFQHDALNRVTVKLVPERAGLDPAHTRDVYYGYDWRGLQTHARFDSPTGEGVTNAYDGLGRLSSSTTNMGGTARTLGYKHDVAGNRTRVTHPDGIWFGYDHDGRGQVTAVKENGGTVLAGFAYDEQGLRESVTRASGAVTSYDHDKLSRLKLLGHELAGTGHDLTLTFEYNPASQIPQNIRSNEAYALLAPAAGTTGYTANGLNQYTNVEGAAIMHDLNGNMTSDGSTTFTYDVENRLVGASAAKNAALTYDPMGRLREISTGGATTRFLYDGDRLVEERDGALRRRPPGRGA